jgi:PPOX class probable F420-dependent enzyme
MPLIDPSTDFGARVARRLADETIGWLVTVDAEGTPQPSPVWYLWDGETILIYSNPGRRSCATSPATGASPSTLTATAGAAPSSS